MRIPSAPEGDDLRALLDDLEIKLSDNQPLLDGLLVETKQTHDRMMRCYDALAQLRASFGRASNSDGGREPT